MSLACCNSSLFLISLFTCRCIDIFCELPHVFFQLDFSLTLTKYAAVFGDCTRHMHMSVQQDTLLLKKIFTWPCNWLVLLTWWRITCAMILHCCESYFYFATYLWWQWSPLHKIGKTQHVSVCRWRLARFWRFIHMVTQVAELIWLFSFQCFNWTTFFIKLF